MFLYNYLSSFFDERNHLKKMFELEEKELQRIVNESEIEYKNSLKNNTQKPFNTKEYKPSYRVRAIQLISDEMKCVNCGCDDTRILEINHKNGDGKIERKTVYSNSHAFYKAIINRTRSVDDLELTCKVCNWIHFIKFKFGIRGHKITFDPR